jgi:PAS domain S-box-containing protein
MDKKSNKHHNHILPPGLDWWLIFEHMPQGVIVIDLHFNIISVNRMFSVVTGIGREKVSGKKCFDIIAGPLCRTFNCPMKRMQKGVELLEFKGEEYFAVGEQIPCIVSVSPYVDVNGHFAGIVENITDIGIIMQTRIELKESHDRLRKAMGGIIQAISLTIEKRDPYTAGHQRRVAKFCRVIAHELGFSWERIQGLRMAAAIHDLGKIHVPAAILNKPGKLSKHEMAIIKMHPQTAYDILRGIDFPWHLAEIIFQHHERLNGTGYPRGLKGDQIIQEAQILAVSDVCEAMSSFRPYRPELGIDAAIKVLKNDQGRLYDAEIVDIAIDLLSNKGFNFKTKYRI